jgi:hypothetical protein
MQHVHSTATTRRFARLAAFWGLAAVLASSLASCRSEDTEPDLIQPIGSPYSFGPDVTMNRQMQAVIE